MVAGMRFKAAMVTALACAAGSCTSCEGDPNQFNAEGALDDAAFVAEARLEGTTKCSVDCDWGHLWRYEVSPILSHIGVAPPFIVTAFSNYPETNVLVAARRFANGQTPRFLLVGAPVLGPGGEDGAICGLGPTVPVMLLDGENVFVFNASGDGLAAVVEVMDLHDSFPGDGREDGYTFQQRADAYARKRPLKTALDAIERSRQRRPTRELFSTDGRERVCRQAGNGDAGEPVEMTACDAGRSPIGERACN